MKSELFHCKKVKCMYWSDQLCDLGKDDVDLVVLPQYA